MKKALTLIPLLCVVPRAWAQQPTPAPTPQPPTNPAPPTPDATPQPAVDPAPPAEPPPPPPPDPTPVPVAPIVAEAKPAEKPKLGETSLFGRVQMLFGVDPQNTGDVPDFTALPDGVGTKLWSSNIQFNGALGGRFKLNKPIGGFAARAQFVTAVFIRRVFTVPSAEIALEDAKRGMTIRVGRMFAPTVNSLNPGTFQFPVSFGSVINVTSGALVMQKLGPMELQVGVGRPDFPLFTTPIPDIIDANPRLPYAEGRIAYVDNRRKGQLPASAMAPHRPMPLTVSVSGGIGKQRVGIGEKPAVAMIDPMAVDPKVEDLISWIVSGEVAVPVGKFLLAGEIYGGKGTNVYFGGFSQRPRVNAMTGEHHNLGTFGGWAQLSYSDKGWTALALAGYDAVTSGLDKGLPTDAPRLAPLGIRPGTKSNRLLAASVAHTFESTLRVGLQFQQLETKFHSEPTGTALGFIGEVTVLFP